MASRICFKVRVSLTPSEQSSSASSRLEKKGHTGIVACYIFFAYVLRKGPCLGILKRFLPRGTPRPDVLKIKSFLNSCRAFNP